MQNRGMTLTIPLLTRFPRIGDETFSSPKVVFVLGNTTNNHNLWMGPTVGHPQFSDSHLNLRNVIDREY